MTHTLSKILEAEIEKREREKEKALESMQMTKANGKYINNK